MKSFSMSEMTLKEFADFLTILKNEDWPVSICGMGSFFLNVDEENQYITFDTENLSERE